MEEGGWMGDLKYLIMQKANGEIGGINDDLRHNYNSYLIDNFGRKWQTLRCRKPQRRRSRERCEVEWENESEYEKKQKENSSFLKICWSKLSFKAFRIYWKLSK